MSVWTTLKNLLLPLDRGFLVRGGRELKWRRDALPVPVYFHPDTPEAMVNAVHRATSRFNDAIGTLLFFSPAAAVAEMLPYFEDDELRKGFSQRNNLVLVAPGFGDPKGHTYLQWDTRTGELRTALVHIPINVAGHVLAEMMEHEIGHVLGLDHDGSADSIMFHRLRPAWAPRARDGAEVACAAEGRLNRLSQLDIDRLRSAYLRPPKQSARR